MNRWNKPFEIAVMAAMILWTNIALGEDNQSSPRLFGDMVGLNVKYSQGEPAADIGLLKELRVKWVRDCAGWGEVEKVPGEYVFPQEFSDRLKFYKENGIGVCYILAYENPKAYPDTAQKPLNSINAEAYGRYAVAAAKYLKASGVRFVLEIWNEPHNFVLGKKVGGQWNGKLPSPWVDHYISMVGEAVRQVKAYDPAVRLLDDDDMWIIHYWFLEKGLPKDLDGFAFHPYAGASFGPEMAAVGQDTSWAKPFTMTDADRSMQSAVRRLRDQGVAKMGKTPALWATEWGWSVNDKAPFSTLTPDGHMNEEAVASYVPRAFITAAAAGVETVLWFSSYDGPDGPMGLRSNDGKRRQAFGAFKTMTKQLGAYTLVKHVVGTDHLTSGVQAYLFHGDDGYKLVAWDVDGTAGALLSEKASGKIQIADLQGRAVRIENGADGRGRLALSQSPIYIAGISGDVAMELEPPAGSAAPVYLFPASR
jgi:hypothetical protein